MLHPWSFFGSLRGPAFGTSRRPACALDRWRDGFRLLEAHQLPIAAPPARALEALADSRIGEMPIVSALFTLRGMGVPADWTLRATFSTTPFAILEEEAGREFVFGIMLPPRGRSAREVCASPAAFREALGSAPLGVVANFRAEPHEGGSILWTETWARTRGRRAGLAFGAYWLLIGPFSAWIRRIFLGTARRRAERAG
ncbi:MAG: hypothetical protein QM704_10485 [Anaeromyxobacteraceae bacterium]